MLATYREIIYCTAKAIKFRGKLYSNIIANKFGLISTSVSPIGVVNSIRKCMHMFTQIFFFRYTLWFVLILTTLSNTISPFSHSFSIKNLQVTAPSAYYHHPSKLVACILLSHYSRIIFVSNACICIFHVWLFSLFRISVLVTVVEFIPVFLISTF